MKLIKTAYFRNLGPTKFGSLKNFTGSQRLFGLEYVEYKGHKGVNFEYLTYQRVVVRLGTGDDFSLRFFSKPRDRTELQNQELIENS